MNGPEALKKIEGSYREQKRKILNDPFIHLHERVWFLVVEKELTLFRAILKAALSEDSDKKFIEEATEEDVREAYRNDELPKKVGLSADCPSTQSGAASS